MVLTFTGSLSIAESGREDVRTMLIGALGCNIAWGIIDAILFLMGVLAAKGESLAAWNAVRQTTDPAAGRQIVADALPPVVASLLTTAELDSLRERLRGLPNLPGHAAFDRTAWRGAVAVFLLVVVTTFPVVVPFLVLDDAQLALRISNAIAIAMLFLTGYAFARLTGRQPWFVGALMVVIGVTLVAITMALGG